jgi:hypothetical protein
MSADFGLVYVTIYRRNTDPRDVSWHREVTLGVHELFGGVRTSWNFAWIEYHVKPSEVDRLKAYFKNKGFKVQVGNDVESC